MCKDHQLFGMSSNSACWLYNMFVGWAQAEWTFADLALFCGFPSVCPSVTFYVNKGGPTKQYLLNYSVHSYHQKVKIIKQILTFVVRWIRDNIFQAKDVFTSHARWIRLLLEKYYHVFTSTKVNICIISLPKSQVLLWSQALVLTPFIIAIFLILTI